MNQPWADFERLTADLSDLLDHEPNHGNARIIMRALSYLYWQKTVIEEVKSDRATLEAMLRDK